MQSSENNWYTWQYDHGPLNGRRLMNDDSVFRTIFSSYSGMVGTYKEELIKTAKSVIDFCGSEKPSIMFSGGMESEVMLRAFIDAGVKPSVYVFRYENDFNIYDVSYAITLCSTLNVEYKLINFNLHKFFENDADSIADLAQIDKPLALPYCKFIELVDGVPVFGRGELNPMRIDANIWVQRCYEWDVSRIKYASIIGRKAIPEWFKWTPGLVLAQMNTVWFDRLTHNGFTATTPESTKLLGYREAYPDLIYRVKKTGYEMVKPLTDEFEKHLQQKFNGFKFRATLDRPVRGLRELISAQ